MPRRPALLTQAEVARAIRGARQAGASQVRIQPDGTIVVELSPMPTVAGPEIQPEQEGDFVP